MKGSFPNHRPRCRQWPILWMGLRPGKLRYDCRPWQYKRRYEKSLGKSHKTIRIIISSRPLRKKRLLFFVHNKKHPFYQEVLHAGSRTLLAILAWNCCSAVHFWCTLVHFSVISVLFKPWIADFCTIQYDFRNFTCPAASSSGYKKCFHIFVPKRLKPYHSGISLF